MNATERGEFTVSVYLARGLLGHAARQGVSPEEVCRTVGLEPAVLDDLEFRIPARVFKSIWDEVACRSRDEDFGLHLGVGAAFFRGGHVLYTVLRNCPTLGDAMDRFCRYHGLAAELVKPRLQSQGSRATITLESVHRGVVLDRHQAEALLASVASMFRDLVDGGVPLLQVRFTHPQPREDAALQRFFDCPLRFRASSNALVFAREDLSRPLVLADPELLETLEDFVQMRLARLREAGGWAGKVRRWFGQTLPRGGKPTLDSAAQDLGVSCRQLQRRLQEEDTSYQKLLDQVREELAVAYLKRSDATLCELAFLLGYSEQSAFNHAFKRWTGSTPGQFMRA